MRVKNKETLHGKFEWFGVGASSKAHDGDVVSSNSDDSERDMESLSSESDDGEATWSRCKQKME